MPMSSAVAGVAPGYVEGEVGVGDDTAGAVPLLMPTVRLVPVMVRVILLVTVVYVTHRALVLLVMLMVRVVSVVLRVLAPLVKPIVRALQLMQWWMVPLVML